MIPKLNPKAKHILSIIGLWFRRIMLVFGVILFISIILSFTDLPFRAYFWLGTHNTELEEDPDWIVLMGGGGMPGPDALLRCYFASEIAEEYPEARLIVAVPGDDCQGEDCPAPMMRNELILRGVDSLRIFMETQGVNTRTQAINIRKIVGRKAVYSVKVRIVTSPEHMYRAVKVFRKIGFRKVGGRPAFEQDIPEKLLKKKGDRKLKEQTLEALDLRYNMWNYMKYEITVLRECCALAYYKIRGWI
ncbi:MAG: YdcF family protein [Bacteroidales bacterium]|nr:YdcF family protein [Bacteroidales bacterium]